jgi:hypothetical protein
MLLKVCRCAEGIFICLGGGWRSFIAVVVSVRGGAAILTGCHGWSMMCPLFFHTLTVVVLLLMLLLLPFQIEGHTICALGDAAAWPVQGLIRHFR